MRLSILVALAALLGPVFWLVPSTSAAPVQGSLKASPAQPVLGEQVALSGSVPATKARPVRLERNKGGSWVRVGDPGRTSRAGRFTFSVATPKKKTQYRVVAPRVSKGGKVLMRAVQTPQVAVPAGSPPLLVGVSREVENRVLGSSSFEASNDLDYWVQMNGDDDVVAGQGQDGGAYDLFVFDRFGSDPVWVTGPDEEQNGHRHWYGSKDMSADGTWVLYEHSSSEDDAEVEELLLWNRLTGETEVVARDDSTDDQPYFGWAEITNDNRYVFFFQDGGQDGDAIDIKVHDRQTGATSTVVGSDASADILPQFDVSPDGRFVAYVRRTSEFGRLVAYRLDRTTGETVEVGKASDGGSLNDDVTSVAVSPDGRYAAYLTTATNVSPADTNAWPDTYLYDTETARTTLLSVCGTRSCRNAFTLGPRFLDGGKYVFTGISYDLYDLSRGWLQHLYEQDAKDEPQRVFGNSGLRQFSADGSKLLYWKFVDDSNPVTRTFLWERVG